MPAPMMMEDWGFLIYKDGSEKEGELWKKGLRPLTLP